MLPCEVAASFERSCCELPAKLLRTSREAVLRTSSKVVVYVERNCCEVGTYFKRSYVRRLYVAKELHALRTGVYVALEVKRIQSILWSVQYGKFKQQRIVSLWHEQKLDY